MVFIHRRVLHNQDIGSNHDHNSDIDELDHDSDLNIGHNLDLDMDHDLELDLDQNHDLDHELDHEFDHDHECEDDLNSCFELVFWYFFIGFCSSKMKSITLI